MADSLKNLAFRKSSGLKNTYMNDYNLNDKKFKSIENSINGDISSDTVFHYRQESDKIWAILCWWQNSLGHHNRKNKW